MRFPQVVIYENDGLLAHQLRGLARANQWKWALREATRPEACLRLLRRGGPTVLVMRAPPAPIAPAEPEEKCERILVQHLELADQIHWSFPETALVVVSEKEDPLWADLGWHLGATCVLAPPTSRQQVVDVVVGLMETASGKGD